MRSKCLYNLGNVFLLQGDVEDAISAFRDSLLIESGSERTIHNLSLALHMRKKKQENLEGAAPKNQPPKKQIKPLNGKTSLVPSQEEGQSAPKAPPDDTETPLGEEALEKRMNDVVQKLQRLEKRSKQLQRKRVKQHSEIGQAKENNVTW